MTIDIGGGFANVLSEPHPIKEDQPMHIPDFSKVELKPDDVIVIKVEDYLEYEESYKELYKSWVDNCLGTNILLVPMEAKVGICRRNKT